MKSSTTTLTTRSELIVMFGVAATLSIVACDRSDGASATTRNPTVSPGTTGTRAASDNMTPMNQSQSSEHVRITAEIRRGIMNAEDMSINAQNCKIITDESSTVTLRGAVNSKAEKDAIGAIARATAGVASVNNQLEVRPE
jgi:osmotically-inducible protein OsmY